MYNTASADELKTCPFCGKKDFTVHPSRRVVSHNFTGCILAGYSFSLDTWNTRPVEDALFAENATLRAENSRLADEAERLRNLQGSPQNCASLLGVNVPEQKVYRITNFVTKEDVPYPRVANSNTRKPSEKWIEGWNDCMEGRAKKSTFGMSTEEHNDYLEGYEAAERD